MQSSVRDSIQAALAADDRHPRGAGRRAGDLDAGDFPARNPGEPSTINLTRRIEFHLLYPWLSPKSKAIGPRVWSVCHPPISRSEERGRLGELAGSQGRSGVSTAKLRSPVVHKVCQVVSWALARSPGPCSPAWARLKSFWEAGLFQPLYWVRVRFANPEQPLSASVTSPQAASSRIPDLVHRRPRSGRQLAAARPR